MKLLVLSICKDEEKTIGQVLDAVPSKIKGISSIEKWVIDDGSQDTTVKVAKKHGANVLSDGSNKKLAFRFREAVDLALERGADLLVNIDGDMQFNPAHIPYLVQPIVDNSADFVAADRFTNKETGKPHQPKNMPLVKYWGNRLGATIVSKLSEQKFNDVTCGFRAYNRKALMSLNIAGKHTYTQESFQILAAKRIRIKTIPTEVTYFKGRKSRVVTNVPKYILVSGVNIVRFYRDFAPLRFFGIIGVILFIIGAILSGVFFGHWVVTGSFSPYKFLGFAGIYFVTLAIIFGGLGLVADMLSRILSNQEKMFEHLQDLRFNGKNKK